MTDQPERPGSSGIFKAIVLGARKFKRATSKAEVELTSQTVELCNKIAQAFIAGRLGDVHTMMTPMLQERSPRAKFETRWRDTVRERGPLIGFGIANVGQIDLDFIPGLEDVPQAQFVAFVEIAFSSPEIPFDDDGAFIIGVVLLDEHGETRVGAIHTR